MVAGFFPARPRISSVHFGGGTPNMLLPDHLDAIFEALHQFADFEKDAEIAAELDPRTLTPEWIARARAHGLNRVSLGVQDFDAKVQAAVDRVQPLGMVREQVSRLRAAGIGGINIDLMYGLPHQTQDSCLATADAVTAMQPDRIALFGYAHVPWMKPAQKLIDESALPDGRTRLRQKTVMTQWFADAGYAAIGFDHFAAPGDAMVRAQATGELHRNFQGYTIDRATTLLGFGASAIGKLTGGYVQAPSAVPAWRAAIRSGQLPVARGVRISAEDRLRAEVIERLMCDMGADLGAICRRHDSVPDHLLTDDVRERLDVFAADGLIETVCDNPASLRVTERGRAFLRTICAAFDQYLVSDAATRHSTPV